MDHQQRGTADLPDGMPPFLALLPAIRQNDVQRVPPDMGCDLE